MYWEHIGTSDDPSTDSQRNHDDYVILHATEDDKKFIVHRNLMRASALVAKMLEDACGDDNNDDIEIPVGYDGAVVVCCLDFAEYHLEHPRRTLPKPLGAPLQDLVDPWDYTFFTTRLLEDGDTAKTLMLRKVMCASNFLIMDDLREFTCACLGSILAPMKTSAEVLAVFGVSKSDIKPEHYEALYQQYPYLRPAPSS
eukprot:PhM_4_TR13804/c0_g1_i1/m.70683/K03094/SKP1, CBF3D; S-phase kinase-associated protein 1